MRPKGFYYQEFRDPEDEEWRYLVDKKGKITSLDITDVLDHFGNDGWELVHMRPLKKERRGWDVSLIPFDGIALDDEFECIFKRQIDES